MKKNNMSLFTNVFDSDFPFISFKNETNKLKTDIQEYVDKYVFKVNVAGLSKENINITVDEGYLVVTVKEDQTKEENNDTYIRREILHGACSRSYYIGEVKEENIKAAYKDGIVTIEVPKTDVENEKKAIVIN